MEEHVLKRRCPPRIRIPKRSDMEMKSPTSKVFLFIGGISDREFSRVARTQPKYEDSLWILEQEEDGEFSTNVSCNKTDVLPLLEELASKGAIIKEFRRLAEGQIE